ncbi:MAG: T9SS type A sorting domain-containing protein [Chitinophagaceae bacterium]|nr:T9SS type A sorting domain-containing protein [Chitinophagaceae bacterium]
MKKINIFFALVGLAGILLSNTQGGFTLDYTGSTGLNGSSCGASNCHMGTMGVDSSILNVKVMSISNVDITKTAGGYTPGATYSVEVKLKVGAKVKAGFQCVPLTFMSSLPAGTVQNNVMPTMIQITPDAQSRQYVSHTTTGATSPTVISGGYASWKFNWQAPATDVGALNFHCIANISNNNNLSDGDSIVMATYVIQKPSGLPELTKYEELAVYPNPTNNMLYIPNTAGHHPEVWIMNPLGIIVKHISLSNSTLNVDQLPTGNYLLFLRNDDGNQFRANFSKY